jgi:hypothetical protein
LPRFCTFRAALVVASALLGASAALANPAHIRIAGPLQSQPAPKAPIASSVKAGTSVDIVERKGFWARVRSGAQTGWLKLDRLSLDSGGSASEIAALASGRTGSNNVVSASGGRGLDAADLARATPDTAAVAALSHSAVNETAAAQFARTGGLKTRHIDYIREPKTPGRGPR